jgi:hypothetical protein
MNPISFICFGICIFFLVMGILISIFSKDSDRQAGGFFIAMFALILAIPCGLSASAAWDNAHPELVNKQSK